MAAQPRFFPNLFSPRDDRILVPTDAGVYAGFCSLASTGQKPYIRGTRPVAWGEAVLVSESRVQQRFRAEAPGVVISTGDPHLIARDLGEHWVRRAVGRDLPVQWGPASATEAGPTVGLSLLSAVPVMVPRQSRELPPVRLVVRLAVAVRAPTRPEADAVLLALAFSAAEFGSPEIEAPTVADPPLVEQPPVLVVRIILERPRAGKTAPLVRAPLVTQWSVGTSIRGRVLGPHDTPVAGALVEVAGSSVAEYSNHRGEFSLPAVGRGDDLVPVLVISARGLKVQHRLGADANPHEVVVRLPIPEPDQ